MYGIINNALQDMVIRDFGEDKWHEIVTASGIKEDVFLSMQTYDDDVTYRLIGAASQQLDTDVDQCLELFGRYWILDAAPQNYAMVLDATGTEILSFIENINSLHDRITSTFPNYVPPEFFLEHLEDGRHLVHYISTRVGLSAFVAGLLGGLGERFSCSVDILHREQLSVATGEHWVFTVRIQD